MDRPSLVPPLPPFSPVEEPPRYVEEPAYVDNYDDEAAYDEAGYRYEYEEWDDRRERQSSGAGAFAILGFLALGVLALGLRGGVCRRHRRRPEHGWNRSDADTQPDHRGECHARADGHPHGDRHSEPQRLTWGKRRAGGLSRRLHGTDATVHSGKRRDAGLRLECAQQQRERLGSGWAFRAALRMT